MRTDGLGLVRRIHCFENVQVLVFVAALSEYDQQLWEDESGQQPLPSPTNSR